MGIDREGCSVEPYCFMSCGDGQLSRSFPTDFRARAEEHIEQVKNHALSAGTACVINPESSFKPKGMGIMKVIDEIRVSAGLVEVPKAGETISTDVKPTSQAETQSCVHHWIIDPPHGAESHGCCVKCGSVKDFPNALPGYDPHIKRTPYNSSL